MLSLFIGESQMRIEISGKEVMKEYYAKRMYDEYSIVLSEYGIGANERQFIDELKEVIEEIYSMCEGTNINIGEAMNRFIGQVQPIYHRKIQDQILKGILLEALEG